MFKFDSAIKATPDEVHIIDQYAKMLEEIAVLKANAGMRRGGRKREEKGGEGHRGQKGEDRGSG
jgi:hypothetical protein